MVMAGSMIQQNIFTTRGVILTLACIVLGLPPFTFHIMRE